MTWQSLHNQLIGSRDSAQGSNDSVTVSAVLLVCEQFAPPPTSARDALATLRGVLAGTYALDKIETVFHSIVK